MKFFLACLFCSLLFSFDFEVEEAEIIIRNYLADEKQEALTTSLNWSFGVLPRQKQNFHQKVKIVLDPGHGGDNDGAKGLFNIREKHLTLTFANLLKKELLKWGAEVFLTREKDVSLSLKERVKFANLIGADVFLSIHANSSPFQDIEGFEIYFLSSEPSDVEASRLSLIENGGETPNATDDIISIISDVKTNIIIEKSSHLAESIYNNLSLVMKSNKRGVRQAPFSVLMGTDMPAILLEVGYLSNPTDAKRLKNTDYLKKIASAISKGIKEYVKNNYGEHDEG